MYLLRFDTYILFVSDSFFILNSDKRCVPFFTCILYFNLHIFYIVLTIAKSTTSIYNDVSKYNFIRNQITVFNFN